MSTWFAYRSIRRLLDAHPNGATGLPSGWQTTFEMARDEIEGRTSGAFKPGFVADLAALRARRSSGRRARNVGVRQAGRAATRRLVIRLSYPVAPSREA